jgi:hypothetical protein
MPRPKKIVDAGTYNGGPGEEGNPVGGTPGIGDQSDPPAPKRKYTRRAKSNGSLDELRAEFKEEKAKLVQRYQDRILKLMAN